MRDGAGDGPFLASDTLEPQNVAQIPHRLRFRQNVTYKLLILKHKQDICWPTTCYN